MKRTLFTSGAILAVLASAIYAFGDIARPKPSPAVPHTWTNSGLTIVPNPGAYSATLLISQGTLERINKLAANGGTRSVTESVMQSSSRTIMAGLFMFLAISFAGVWFARSSQRRNRKTVAAVLGLAGIVGGGTGIG